MMIMVKKMIVTEWVRMGGGTELRKRRVERQLVE